MGSRYDFTWSQSSAWLGSPFNIALNTLQPYTEQLHEAGPSSTSLHNTLDNSTTATLALFFSVPVRLCRRQRAIEDSRCDAIELRGKRRVEPTTANDPLLRKKNHQSVCTEKRPFPDPFVNRRKK